MKREERSFQGAWKTAAARYCLVGAMLVAGALAGGCKSKKQQQQGEETQPMTDTKQPTTPDKVEEDVETQFKAWKRVEEQLAKLVRVKLAWDKTVLDDKRKQMLGKILEAARVMDDLFLKQVSIRNTQIRADLKTANDPKKDVIERFFNINFGPYNRFDEYRPFINVPYRPKGATFYPPNMKKEEFSAWIEKNPKQKEAFESNFTIIKRTKDGLEAIPYNEFYRDDLEKAAGLLNEAAALSGNESLKKYLTSRAKAFLANDYYESDVDWMDLDGHLIDVTIGPYETYEDTLFGFKAAFEAFICLRDPKASEDLGKIKGYLHDMEAALPLDEKYKGTAKKKETPISVVDVIYTAGDARAGVQTIAFNLPNDERIRNEKGSKKVLLRNLINAKYDGILVPLSKVVLHADQREFVSRDEFFNHVLLHEISHGIGPGYIEKGGKETEVRVELKDLYSAIEEAKADVLGMTNTLFLIEKGFYGKDAEKRMWVTFLASIFRSVRFGVDEAHGKANAVILNYILEKGGYTYDAVGGTFKVDFDKIGQAATDLARELLTIEATGNYDGAKTLIDKYGELTPMQEEILAKLEKIPVDIEPVFDLDF